MCARFNHPEIRIDMATPPPPLHQAPPGHHQPIHHHTVGLAGRPRPQGQRQKVKLLPLRQEPRRPLLHLVGHPEPPLPLALCARALVARQEPHRPGPMTAPYPHRQGVGAPHGVNISACVDKKAGLALFCPITSKIKGYPFEVTLPYASRISGVILADQVKSLDWRARHAEFSHRTTPQVIGQVVGKIRAMLEQKYT